MSDNSNSAQGNATAALLRIMSSMGRGNGNSANNSVTGSTAPPSITNIMVRGTPGSQVVRSSAPRQFQTGSNSSGAPLYPRSFISSTSASSNSLSSSGRSATQTTQTASGNNMAVIPRFIHSSSSNSNNHPGLAVAATLGRNRDEDSSLQRLVPSITNYIRSGSTVVGTAAAAERASSAGIASYYSQRSSSAGAHNIGNSISQQFQHAYNIYSQNQHNHNHLHHHHHQHERTSERSSSGHHGNTASVHPHFRAKVVCQLTCRHCSKIVCKRGMKAILLADANVELFSTDSPPKGVQLVEEDYTTANCRCKIRDLACLTCGNVIGYHVTQPCDTCLESCNNGHFWMFLSDSVSSRDRLDSSGDKAMLWAHLPYSEADVDFIDPYDFGCR